MSADCLLDMLIVGLPPSKNRRTRVNKKKGTIYTEGSVRAWMEAVAFDVHHQRKMAWEPGMHLTIIVRFWCTENHLWKWDVDGALPCLVDAVCAGLMPDDRKRPPDEWVTTLLAIKEKADWDSTHITVNVEED